MALKIETKIIVLYIYSPVTYMWSMYAYTRCKQIRLVYIISWTLSMGISLCYFFTDCIILHWWASQSSTALILH